MRSELDVHYDKYLQSRIGVAYLILIVVFGVLCLRLWYLQIVEGVAFRALSEGNRIRIQKIKAPRGLILDSLNQTLAGNRPSFDICLVPQDARQPEVVLARLSGILGFDLALLLDRVKRSRGRPPFESVKLLTDVPRDTLGKVLAHKLDLPGITVEAIPVRDYPRGMVASHLLGHLGEIGPRELAQADFSHYKLGDFIGRYGVEKIMEKHLKGTDGGYQAEVNAVGYKINIMGRIDPIPAHNVVLTINAELQAAAEKALAEKSGAIIAVDPRNGKVLAMASSPAFNPNLFSRGISSQDWSALINNPQHPLMNRCVQALHPPGSTFKLITAAAALGQGLVDPNTTFFCGGSLRCGNRTFRCWKKTGHGKVDLMKGLTESCDVFFYNLGSLLDPDVLAGYARDFGFGSPTGINLNDEKSGLVPTTSWYQQRHGFPWQPGESFSVSIGQGALQTTPLQLVMAYAALANGGTLYRPLFTEGVFSANGNPEMRVSPFVRGHLPLSEENISFLKECLGAAVNAPSGTGVNARLAQIEVAGKTGTAQVIATSKEGIENPSRGFRDHAWFVAFAPKADARIAVVVLVEHGGHGGSAAAPLAKDLLSTFFRLEEEGHV